jgi:hypothetical protein
LRWRAETFFLQHYLQHPLGETLPAFGHAGAPRLVEVCHLAAWQRNAAAPFVRAIVALCLGAGADWALFTATAPLRRLLGRLDIPFVAMAAATADRVTDAARWGRYYDCDPWVCAVGRDALQPRLAVPAFRRDGVAA